MISDGYRLADIGTDHAYVPIYLCQKGKIPSAIAMDIRTGPLERAREHIAFYEMENRIETRLSDGAASLFADEADSILLAGMGGGLAINIMEMGRNIFCAAKEVILQPQSKLQEVRVYLEQQGYVTDIEDMVFEEGKYYPMFRVHYAPAECDESGKLFHIYGKYLLAGRHPVLFSYLQKEKKVYTDILSKLAAQPYNGRIAARRAKVAEILHYNGKALEYWNV